MDKFGLNKKDFDSYEEYKKEYNKLYKKTDAYKKYEQSEHYKKISTKARKKLQATPEWKKRYKQYLKEYYKTDAYKKYCESRKEYNKLYKQSEKYKQYLQSDSHKESQKRYRQSQKRNDCSKRYYQKKGKDFARIKSAEYRACKLKRTPIWSEKELIKEFYMNCPKGCEVDHIIPLQGEKVSGLHVIGNLQYLTMYENRVKSNKLVS